MKCAFHGYVSQQLSLQQRWSQSGYSSETPLVWRSSGAVRSCKPSHSQTCWLCLFDDLPAIYLRVYGVFHPSPRSKREPAVVTYTLDSSFLSGYECHQLTVIVPSWIRGWHWVCWFLSRGSVQNMYPMSHFTKWKRGHALQLKIPVYDYIWLGWITIATLK